MSDLLRRVFPPNQAAQSAQAAQNGPTSAEVLARLEQQLNSQISELNATAAALEKHLARLSKEQFKANTLAESAAADAHAAVQVARTAMERLTLDERPAPLRAATNGQAPTLRLLEALMPILDGIENGLESGERQLILLGGEANESARAMLGGWLDGQRLLRDRVLALFDKEGIRLIPTLGQRFDPYRHVAVESVPDETRPVGTIIAERRHGYETAERVLRFAEVVVTRQPKGG